MIRYTTQQKLSLSLNAFQPGFNARQIEQQVKSICSSLPFITQYYFVSMTDESEHLDSKNLVKIPLKRLNKTLIVVFSSLPEFLVFSHHGSIFAFIVVFNLWICALLYGVISWYILTPVQELDRVTHSYISGEPVSGVSFGRRNNYIGQFGTRFNRMLFELARFEKQAREFLTKTDQKLDEAENAVSLAERLASTGRLAAGIAHEINNPLGGMINAARMLLRIEPQAPKTREYLLLIMDGLLRIQETVRKIRHFQFCNTKTSMQLVDISDVITRSLTFIQHTLDEKKITVVKEMPEQLPVVMGNPGDLQQALLNILKNAMEAIDQEGRISISTQKKDRYIELLISDTGCGMTEEETAQAFDLFYTKKSSMKGSGLGLAIVHNVIQNHGGKIELSSIKHTGTTVKIMLPLHAELVQRVS